MLSKVKITTISIQNKIGIQILATFTKPIPGSIYETLNHENHQVNSYSNYFFYRSISFIYHAFCSNRTFTGCKLANF